MKLCVICGKVPKEEVIDSPTGFKFCIEHLNEVNDIYYKNQYKYGDPFSTWLTIIVKLRNQNLNRRTK